MGARLKALYELIFKVPSDFIGFFYHSNIVILLVRVHHAEVHFLLQWVGGKGCGVWGADLKTLSYFKASFSSWAAVLA